jgi:predicted N-acetyltransferase YhbS
LETPEEVTRFAELGVGTFFHVPSETIPAVAAGWSERIEHNPRFAPEQRCGAFRDGSYVGGYLIQERELRMGTARIPTGCIGMVITVEQYRRQGVASALLADALRFSRERHLGFLLLDGIPNFYAQFGYTDVFDITVQAIDRAAIRQQPPSPVPVRFATPDDAPAMLALYDQRYGGYTGSFARTLAEEQQLLSMRSDNAPLVALGSNSAPMGYLYFGWGGDRAFGLEVTADDFPTALALLQRQDELLREAEGQERHDGEETAPATVVRWRLPGDCPAAYALADHLTGANAPSEGEPGIQWSVCPQTYVLPNAAWMARVGDLDALLSAALPEWQRRLAGKETLWQGAFALAVGGETYGFRMGEGGLERVEGTAANGEPPLVAQLTPQAFTQLLWGYCPISWIACQDAQRVPAPLQPLLAAIFPPGNAWIAGTDDF